MALTTTNAQISIQDGALAAVNLTSGTTIGTFTPGANVTFALQSTTGVQTWTLTFNCPTYAGLHGRTFDWHQGQVNAFVIQMPANALVTGSNVIGGIQVISVVSDGQQSIATAYNFLQSKGGAAVPFQHYADYVMVAALPAYTNTSGTLVGNANGAITSAMADGQTPAVGDTFLLPPGIAGAAADVGLYVITAVGAAGAKFSATQAPDWQTGMLVMPKTEVLVAKGTVFADSTWVVTNTGLTNAIGTASFTLYPRQVALQVTLANGVFAITTVPLLSATKTAVNMTYAGSGTPNVATLTYQAGVVTPGALGTASVTVGSYKAAMAAQNTDTSVLNVLIANQV